MAADPDGKTIVKLHSEDPPPSGTDMKFRMEATNMVLIAATGFGQTCTAEYDDQDPSDPKNATSFKRP